MTLLLDIADLSDAASDAAFEFMCKAAGDDPLSDAIWDAHPSPFIARLVELFTERGLLRLTDCREELQRWMQGALHNPGLIPARPSGSMLRWTPAEMQLVRIYLTALPPASFALEDYMLLTDFLFQRYLPADDMTTEAQWLSTRASLMGRVQGNLLNITAAQADVLLGALPITVAAAKQLFDFTAVQASVMEYADAHAIEYATAFSDGARHSIKKVILDVHQENAATPGMIPGRLQSRLFDQFASLNRDWRRIAITESGNAMLEGTVATLAPGRKLKRVEQYRGSCSYCKSIDGKVVTVVDPKTPDKNGDTMVWSGKTNVGRSAARRKRVGGELIEREPDELYWLPAGLAHPNCRGRWVPTADGGPADPNFSLWVDRLIGESSA
jgi:hypothetical protein